MKIANFKWGCGNFRILVLDELHSATFVKKMNVDPCEIFFVNMHRLTIYILPLLKIISKKLLRNVPFINNLRELYLLSIIDSVNPSIILTAVDNNKNYWCIKNYYPEKKIFLFQNGLRGTTDLKAREIFFLKRRKFEVDHIFIMTRAEKDWYSENGLKAKHIHVCGSIKSNHIELSKEIPEKKLVYLLQYKKHNYRNASQQISRYLNENGENISYQEIYGKNIIAIKTLYEFCKSNLLDFEIFGRAKDEQSALMERDYLKYLGFGHINYVYRTSELDTYQYLDQAKYIVTHGSTLGHEMLSRGRAVFFWSVQRCFGRDTVFGYRKFGDSGEFWTDEIDPVLFCPRLSRFISYSDSDWSQFRVKYARAILPLDDKNTRLHQKLHKATLG